jgi:hypothetical protein
MFYVNPRLQWKPGLDSTQPTRACTIRALQPAACYSQRHNELGSLSLDRTRWR